MTARELYVLGTASQVPTRHRNHNGYFLRWDAEGILFDPGEGTQRQMALAGLSASMITRICITHFHGDHCLGLAGIIQRLSLDNAPLVHVYYPASGQIYFDRLRRASIFAEMEKLEAHPIEASSVVHEDENVALQAIALDHVIECYGYRLTEKNQLRVDQDRLNALGLQGAIVGELLRDGQVHWNGRTIHRDEVAQPRPGQSFAFVMDTRCCDGARVLARDVDLLVCEATFHSSDAELANVSGHLTALQAARLAREAGVRRLVLGHFSQRYPDAEVLIAEARTEYPDVIGAAEPDPCSNSMRHRIGVPARSKTRVAIE